MCIGTHVDDRFLGGRFVVENGFYEDTHYLIPCTALFRICCGCLSVPMWTSLFENSIYFLYTARIDYFSAVPRRFTRFLRDRRSRVTGSCRRLINNYQQITLPDGQRDWSTKIALRYNHVTFFLKIFYITNYNVLHILINEYISVSIQVNIFLDEQIFKVDRIIAS